MNNLGFNGIIRNYAYTPENGVKVSLYKKVGEAITDIDGVFKNIVINQTEEYIAKCEKNGFFDAYSECLYNNMSNISLMKSDSSYPDLPLLFSATDFNTGDSIMLRWTEVSFEYVAGYNIYRTNDLRKRFELVNSELINELSYLDTGITYADTYYYILEVISANSMSYRQGVQSRTEIIGPVKIAPVYAEKDLTYDTKVKIDSTKTNREGEKIYDGNPNTYWESCRGDGAWIEFDFEDDKYISKFYFRKYSVSRGITFASLEYFDGNAWRKIQDVNFLQDIEYTFKDFLVMTKKIRLFVIKTEPLTEAELTEVRIFGL